MKTVAIVQARVRSTRLPAKVLLDLGGATALQRCLDRVACISRIDEIVVATSDKSDDDLIARLAGRLGYRTFRGSEQDVLARFHGAAREAHADAIVRFTSDCPLLDPELSGSVVAAFHRTQESATPAAYASNVQTRRLPRGLDTEIFLFETLDEVHRSAVRSEEREHVTLQIYRNPGRFRLLDVAYPGRDLSHHRWTLDTFEDYRFLFEIYERLGPAAARARLDEVLALLDAEPNLVGINAAVTQKPT